MGALQARGKVDILRYSLDDGWNDVYMGSLHSVACEWRHCFYHLILTFSPHPSII